MPLLDPIPSPVLNADFAALEWEALLALCSSFAASPVGRQAILDLKPSTDEEWIARQHQLTGELRLLLEEQTSVPLGGLFDPTQQTSKAQISGAALEAGELQAIARLANDVASWQALLQSPPVRLVGKLGGLCALSSVLTTNLRPLAESIERTIQPDGTLADNASPELGRIRREQERQKKLIEESLRATLRKLASEGATQEELITIRGERFVIPVRSELKKRVSGVVHGLSSSGQTVYIEPLETIEQNNELVRLIEEEQAEGEQFPLAGFANEGDEDAMRVGIEWSGGIADGERKVDEVVAEFGLADMHLRGEVGGDAKDVEVAGGIEFGARLAGIVEEDEALQESGAGGGGQAREGLRVTNGEEAGKVRGILGASGDQGIA